MNESQQLPLQRHLATSITDTMGDTSPLIVGVEVWSFNGLGIVDAQVIMISHTPPANPIPSKMSVIFLPSPSHARHAYHWKPQTSS